MLWIVCLVESISWTHWLFLGGQDLCRSYSEYGNHLKFGTHCRLPAPGVTCDTRDDTDQEQQRKLGKQCPGHGCCWVICCWAAWELTTQTGMMGVAYNQVEIRSLCLCPLFHVLVCSLICRFFVRCHINVPSASWSSVGSVKSVPGEALLPFPVNVIGHALVVRAQFLPLQLLISLLFSTNHLWPQQKSVQKGTDRKRTSLKIKSDISFLK